MNTCLPLPTTPDEFAWFHRQVTGIDVADAIAAAEAAGVQANPSRPPLRIRFAHGLVFGCFADVWSPKLRTGWQRKLGPLQGAEPLRREDRLLPRHVSYRYTGGPRVERYERRARLKRDLGRGLSGLVTLANRDTKAVWVDRIEHSSDEQYMRLRKRLAQLGYRDAAHFWQVVKGTAPIPARPDVLFALAG